jgi:dsDNA-specific endonuclease/ATPase MutS2
VFKNGGTVAVHGAVRTVDPGFPDSTVGIFQSIFIDIGDQQSIENDLSTYSSHLKNMAFFLQHATDQTLILMDELGSGTDPNFGGAIAQSILLELLQKKVWGVATTHYYNLKLFAGQQTGIRNAAMRFDEKNLVPLYKLRYWQVRKLVCPGDMLQRRATRNHIRACSAIGG